MPNIFDSSSSLSSGYSSLTDSVDKNIELLEESDGSDLNQVELLEWSRDAVLVVTKASTSVIVLFGIFKVEEILRCEYFRYEKPDSNPSLMSRNTSQSRCQKLEANRQIALVTGLKFYKDFLKDSRKSITVYTDLLWSNFGRKNDALVQESLAQVKILHHHQHDGDPETLKYNQCYQAARNLLDGDIPSFKNAILQLGGITFHRIR